MSTFFRSQNRPHGARKKVVLHPYIYSRTGTEVQVGVYCEEPAPESATVIVEVMHQGIPLLATVQVEKGKTDSGSHPSIPIATSAMATLDFYKSTTLKVLRIDNSTLFEAGPQELCPTLLFRIHLSSATSITIPLVGSEYFDGFAAGSVHLMPITPLLESSSMSGVCDLQAGRDSATFEAEVEIQRAPALLESNDRLKINAITHPYCSAECYWMQNFILNADELPERIGSEYASSPANFDKSIGPPTLGEYIKAGVSVFDIDLNATYVEFIK